MTTSLTYSLPERVGLLLEACASSPLNERVAEICRVAVAEELRKLADERVARFETERSVCKVPISRCPFCAAAEKEALQFASPLRVRANALDPDGAR